MYKADLFDISVVMPSLNQMPFIEAAIQSVVVQAGNFCELIVVDGGSTDGTLEVLDRWVNKLGIPISYISESDHGPAEALCKGFGKANGAVIGWLNSDDVYAPRAMVEALEYFENHPDSVMVYGQGRYIDSQGGEVGDYPTKRPKVQLSAFSKGCFICQPTVFFRREVLCDIGQLDNELKTAFDFDFWLRIFRRYPGRIGFIDQVLAYSRIHPDTITSRMRREVALEGMLVLHRHLGWAPPEWLFTYFEELMQRYPFVDQPLNLKEHCAATAAKAMGYMTDEGRQQVHERLRQDVRLKLATPELFVAVEPDGWVKGQSQVRVRLRKRLGAGGALRLTCRHAWPRREAIVTTLRDPWGNQVSETVSSGVFELSLPLPASEVGQDWIFTLSSDRSFVPSEMEPRSQDYRSLSFKVEEAAIVRGSGRHRWTGAAT